MAAPSLPHRTARASAGEQRAALVRRGFVLEYLTMAWNVAGIVILAIAAITARSVALAGFGLDSLIEIGASTVVIWELSGTGEQRQRRGLRLIGYAFAALATYLFTQSTIVLAIGYHIGGAAPFEIGVSRQFVTQRSGELYLGVNASDFAQNSG